MKRPILILIVAMVAILHTVPAGADVVFSNLDGLRTFHPSTSVSYSVVHDDPSRTPPNWDEALSFTTRSRFSLDTIRLPLALWHGTPALNVALAVDDSGRPGRILETIRYTGPFAPSESPVPLAKVTSSKHSMLESNTRYWLVLTAPGPAATDIAVYVSPLHETAEQQLFRSSDLGGSWTCIVPCFNSQRMAFEVTGTPLPNGCPLSIPQLSADPNVQQFEEAASPENCANPAFSLTAPDFVDSTLANATDNLKSGLRSFGITVSTISGYRPFAYQQHLYEVKDRHDRLYQLTIQDPARAATCQQLDMWVMSEIAKHCLKYQQRNGQVDRGHLSVNPATRSSHTIKPARALDLAVKAADVQAANARLTQNGLVRCSTDAAFHVQLASDGDACVRSQSLRAAAYTTRSGGTSVNAADIGGAILILLTDPAGRRIGYDPSAGKTINDFEPGAAYYSGDAPDPEILITDAMDGLYTVTAVGGAAGGSFQLLVQSIDNDHGDIVSEQVAEGTAAPGMPTPSVHASIRTDLPPVTSPSASRRRAVGHP